VVEPVTPFKYNWHIGLISEYLVALTMLQIQNLIINIPPRHMKSLQTMVIWPTWVWIDEPTSRWITGSYSLKLAIRDTLKSRRIIQSDWYQMHFGDRWQLTGDQNEKSRYENNKTGLRMAFGMDSQLTGEGGDFIASGGHSYDRIVCLQGRTVAGAMLEPSQQVQDGVVLLAEQPDRVLLLDTPEIHREGQVVERLQHEADRVVLRGFRHQVLASLGEPERRVAAVQLNAADVFRILTRLVGSRIGTRNKTFVDRHEIRGAETL